MPKKHESPPRSPASGLTFNHAMIYSKDVAVSLHFYSGQLGLRVLEEFQHQGRVVYARLKPPKGNSTIALHQLAPGEHLRTGGARLYFEVKELGRFCDRLESAGLQFSQKPKQMRWGWKHAYLNDPDG